MKKFEQLGRSLSKQEQKEVMGGMVALSDGGQCGINCNLSCSLDCPNGKTAGTCFTARGKCFCDAICGIK